MLKRWLSILIVKIAIFRWRLEARHSPSIEVSLKHALAQMALAQLRDQRDLKLTWAKLLVWKLVEAQAGGTMNHATMEIWIRRMQLDALELSVVMGSIRRTVLDLFGVDLMNADDQVKQHVWN